MTVDGTGRVPAGFIPGLYDTLESQLCIDVTREFASGESNGGMQTYQLGVVLHERLAAISPEFGSFHRGFAMAPLSKVPVLDLHGSHDTTVPANVSLSADGYYYTTVKEIFDGGAYSGGWKKANGCKEKASHWPTQWDGTRDFYCVSECADDDVVRCSWNGGHNWLFNDATANGGLLAFFLLGWTKPTHAGFGRHVDDPDARRATGSPLSDVQIVGVDDRSRTVAEAFAELPSTLLPTAERSRGLPVPGKVRRHHYGDPAKGCLADEEVVRVGSGRACAPKIRLAPARTRNHTAAAAAAAADEDAEPPPPACKLEGGAPRKNGCPNDADVAAGSKAWPICLAKGTPGKELDPYTHGQFHCLLVCPCIDGSNGECAPESHHHCPGTSRCERGDLRNRAHGVCSYH